MSVRRFHDVADMPAPERGDPDDPATYQRIRELWRFSSSLLPRLFAPGLYRYRSIEDSNRARESALIARMRAVRAARAKPGP